MLFALLLSLPVTALAAGALGAPQSVSELSPEQLEIVNFAFTQLSGSSSGDCRQKVANIQKFTSQVVAGTLYKFELTLGDHEDNAPSCPAANPEGKSCSITVWDKPWENFREVQWDQSSCTQDSSDTRGLAGGISKVEKLSAKHQEIVDFGMAQLAGTPGGCQKRFVRVENFGEQVVAGMLYHFDLVLQCDGEAESVCHMKVVDVPWEGGKKVLWDQTTCDGEEKEDTDETADVRTAKKLVRVKLTPSITDGSVSSVINKEEVGPLLEAGDQDYLPHRKRFFGHKKAEQQLIGGDGHDAVAHHGLVGAEPHGPRFADDDTLEMVKVNKLLDSKESKAKLAEMQSLNNFHSFINQHNKVYKNREEYKKRYGIFRENMKKVQFLTQTEQGTGVYGSNHLADISEEEFKKHFLGINELKDDPEVHWPAAKIPDVEVPREMDWRTKGAVTPVKNQGQCGSCWAFSVTGNVEGQYAIKNQKLVSLSEQELVDCDKRDAGCNGGLPENAYKTLLEIGGLEPEADYGYDGEDEKCKFNRSNVVARVSGGLEISQNETQMAQWLLQNGPISVGLNANAMQFYMGGVSHPWKFLCRADGIDHGVLITGFGIHDYPLFHRTMPYWTIKNSWGATWGEQGYYRLYRGEGTCGINMMTSSAVLEE